MKQVQHIKYIQCACQKLFISIRDLNLMTGWGMPRTARRLTAASVVEVKTLEVIILFDDTGVGCRRRTLLLHVYTFLYL